MNLLISVAFAVSTFQTNSNSKNLNQNVDINPLMYTPPICSIIEGESYINLDATLKALENSWGEILKIKGCVAESTKAEDIKSAQTDLATSMSELKKIWASTDAMNKDFATYDAQINKALSGMNTIGETFSTAAAQGADCAGGLTLSSGLMAFADIVKTVGPFALVAIAAKGGTAKSTLTPLALVLGSTWVLETVGNLTKSGGLNMDNPSHRKAILRATCELTRVSEDLKFLRLAQMNKLDDILKGTKPGPNKVELQSVQEHSELLKELIKTRKKNEKSKEEALSKAAILQIQVKKMVSNFNSLNHDRLRCIYSQDLMESMKSEKSPLVAMLNLHKEALLFIPEYEPNPIGVDTILKSIEMQIDTFNKKYSTKKNIEEIDIKDCSQKASSIKDDFYQLHDETFKIFNRRIQQFDAEASQSEEYKIWFNNYISADLKKQIVERIKLTANQLNHDQSYVLRSDFSLRTSKVYNALLSPPSGIRGYGESPLELWLNHIYEQFELQFNGFTQKRDELLDYINDLVKEKLVKKFKKHSLRISSDDIEAEANSLEVINNQSFPLGSPVHTEVCGHLEKTWFAWSVMNDHLGAVDFMCQSVEPLLSAPVGELVANRNSWNPFRTNVLEMCTDKVTYNNTKNNKPLNKKDKSLVTLAKEEIDPKTENYQFAIRVYNKYIELGCPDPKFLSSPMMIP